MELLQKARVWLYFYDVENDFPSIRSKRKIFLKLFDDNLKPFKQFTIKGRLWLQYFGQSNSLCTRTRTIINHAPIRKYRLRFFPMEEFTYLYSVYPIESRYYILHKCKRFNNYWNPRRNSISYFSQFLILNSSTFSFKNSIFISFFFS